MTLDRMNSKMRWQAIFVGLIWALAAGCGGGDSDRIALHPAAGVIRFKGEPLAGAILTFHAVNKPAPSDETPVPVPAATSQDDGTFVVSTYELGDGLPEGQYQITVSCEDRSKGKPKDDDYPELLADRYHNPVTSGLIVKIAPGENELEPLELNP
jgi:hypothetical protein